MSPTHGLWVPPMTHGLSRGNQNIDSLSRPTDHELYLQLIGHHVSPSKAVSLNLNFLFCTHVTRPNSHKNPVFLFLQKVFSNSYLKINTPIYFPPLSFKPKPYYVKPKWLNRLNPNPCMRAPLAWKLTCSLLKSHLCNGMISKSMILLVFWG